MKVKFLCIALLGSAALTVQANPEGYPRGGGGFHGRTVAHAAPAAHAPVRGGGFSSFRSMPVRNFGGRITYPRQRYSSFGMRSYRPTGFRQSPIYRNRATFTRSGAFTAANINQANRFAPRFTNHRNPAITNVWNQRNTGSNFRNRSTLWNGNNLRNGNHRLRGDWQKHVFARQSGDWHRDWDHHSNHWWNGRRCCFINGSWVIFSLGYDPWWPWAWSPPDYFAYGSPYSSYNYPSYGYDVPYSYDYDPGYYNSDDYENQMYNDQNSYPDQSQGYYDSSVYQTEAYYDQPSDSGESNNSTIVAAQERLAQQGYYRGETDGVLNPEMQKAVKRYQITNGLRATGYLDTPTLVVMGLGNSVSY